MGQNIKQSKHYLGGDSSKEASISLPLRAISSGIIVFSMAFLASCLTASILTPVVDSNAETVTTNIDNTGYYVSVTSDDVVMNLVSTPDGSVVVDSDTVTVATNCPSGFKLYISSDSQTSGSNYMYNEDDDSYFLSNTTGSIAGTLKPLDTNSWGYTLLNSSYGNTGSITSLSNFVGIPLLGSEDLIKSTSTANTNGVSTDVYFGVKANTALPAGNYTGMVAYTVFAEATDGSTDVISVSPGVVKAGDNITIATPLYASKDNLGAISVTIDGQTCANPTVLENTGSELVSLTCTVPNIGFIGDKTVAVSFSKYGATYTLANATYYYIGWSSLANMQDMTPYACNEATVATSTDSADYGRNYYSYQRILTDTRDGNTYIVRKLPDGNCWMAENLRLILNGGLAQHTTLPGTLLGLTADNTDLHTQTEWTGGGTSETAANHTAWYSDPANSGNLAKSYTFESEKSEYDDSEQYKGTLYNWLVATAGKGVYGTAGGTTVEDSICPKGWRLPVGGEGNKSFYKLSGSQSSGNYLPNFVLISPPYSFIRVGLYHAESGNVTYSDSGYLWTATVASDWTGIYNLDFKDYYYGISVTNAGRARSVRCVAR